MDFKTVSGFMDKVIDTIKAAEPLGKLIGGPLFSKIAGWTSVAIEIGQNAIGRGTDLNIALTSDDEAKINERIAVLDKLNDELHQRVLRS